MPQLTLPIDPAGPLLEVFLGLEGNTVAALQASGQPIPPLLLTRGLVDTGPDVTAVAPTLLQRLAIPPVATASTHTAGGQATVRLFRVSLAIPSQGGQTGPFFVEPTLLVTELATLLPDADVLTGRDVVLQWLLVLNGPSRLFTLAH